MRGLLLFILSSIAFYEITYAQSHAQLNELKALTTACNQYADSENYKALLTTARQGFQLANALHIDSSINLFSNYLANAYALVKNNADSVVYFSHIAEATALAMHSETKIADAHIALADYYFDIGKPDSIKAYRQKIEQEVHIFQDSTAIIRLYKELTNFYSDDNENEKCLAAYMNVLLPYYERHNDKTNTAVSLVNIGNSYLQVSNSEKALPYFLHALPLLHNYIYGQIVCSNNIGAAYINLKQYDSAIAYLNVAVKISEKIKDTSSIYGTYEKISEVYIGKKDYNKAEKYAKSALQFYQQTQTFLQGIIDGEERMGEIEAGRKNYKSALDYFSDALTRAKTSGYPERTNELYMQMAVAADSAKLYEEAAQYYKTYISFNDSLTRQSNQQTIAKLETQYQTEQKEQQIKLLNQKGKTQELSLQSQRNTTLFLIIALALLSTIITLYIRYRNRLTELRKLNEVRNTISRNLHDEIGATLSSINIYSEVAKNKLEDNNDVHLLLQRITDGSLQMMESMSDIVWYVNPKNDVAKNTIVRMREYAAPILEAKQVNLQFMAEEKIEEIKFTMQQRQHLYLLFKEAINNIAKYAQAKNTIVRINLINDKVYLSITDDGKGFNMSHHKQGNGLLNIQQRTEFLKGKCSIKSDEGKGTTIAVNFPVSL